MTKERLLEMSVTGLLESYPFMESFFDTNGLSSMKTSHKTLATSIAGITEEEAEEWAIDKRSLAGNAYDYLLQMKALLGIDEEATVKSLTLIGGQNKMGQVESFDPFTLSSGEIIAIVGPTGSGKSRLLADIEWTADGDTPTKRRILINGQTPDKKWRFNSSNQLVAQLSQNMNFVMDLSVGEFIELHASSRMIENIDTVVERIIEKANALAGEPFTLDTAITALSGGQSRALMIADTAILSQSPIVLIDEIENAGIDRKKALDLLVSEDKIVLMATHDPILALMANKRIIIKHGGIVDIITTTSDEKAMLSELTKVDHYIQAKRAELRAGARLHMGQSLSDMIQGL